MGSDERLIEDASGYRGTAQRYLTPQSPAEVAEVLAEASRHRIPVTIGGAWTGVTGGGVPDAGWLLSTERLLRLEIDNGRARAGAGVLLKDLHQAAAQTRQLYAPDPTETSASVGGTIATNASGSRSFRYGSTRDHVLSLMVATMDGRTVVYRRGDRIDFDVPAIRLPRSRKNTAGFPLRPGMDWVDLFVGSEGTLGVVCEAELRLLPAAGELLTGVVFFPSERLAVEAVDEWRAVPGLRMIEYFDRPSLDMLRVRFPEVPDGVGAALLLEQEDGEAEDWIRRLDPAGADLDASWFAQSERDREHFRRFRHALPEMVNERMRRQGLMKLGSDYAVPVDRNAEMMRYYRDRLEREFPGEYVVFGHIGDAHVHVNLLPSGEAEYQRGRSLMLELARKAVELGGTVSAEHGLGKRKAGLLAIQYSAEEIEAMKAVKRRLDPGWLLGCGNVFGESCVGAK
jgi:FAD/FMN-containing dehydrogenase